MRRPFSAAAMNSAMQRSTAGAWSAVHRPVSRARSSLPKRSTSICGSGKKLPVATASLRPHLLAPRRGDTPAMVSKSRLRGCGRRILPSVDLLLASLAPLDDVAGREQDLLQLRPPVVLSPQQELEIHAEVLELFLLRVLHDGARLGVGFDGDALLIPVDRLGLLDQGGDHAGEGPGLLWQLGRRLVVLIEAHSLAFPFGDIVADAPTGRDCLARSRPAQRPS